jgi:hypothetical protein
MRSSGRRVVRVRACASAEQFICSPRGECHSSSECTTAALWCCTAKTDCGGDRARILNSRPITSLLPPKRIHSSRVPHSSHQRSASWGTCRSAGHQVAWPAQHHLVSSCDAHVNQCCRHPPPPPPFLARPSPAFRGLERLASALGRPARALLQSALGRLSPAPAKC